MLQREAAVDDLWGAKAIAEFIGCSVDYVYDLAQDPETPVFKPCGRYYATKSELRSWCRKKPVKTRRSQI